MYIDYDSFDEFNDITMTSEYKMFSPGWVARVFGVSRQAVNQWINNDIIDAHRYKEKGSHYVLISESEYIKIEMYRTAHGKY